MDESGANIDDSKIDVMVYKMLVDKDKTECIDDELSPESDEQTTMTNRLFFFENTQGIR